MVAINDRLRLRRYYHYHEGMRGPLGPVSPLIAIDRESARPLHRQIYAEFRSMILERALQPGQQAPSTRALAAELGISRIPVLNAYAQLLAEGYFESRCGSGTFVSSSLVEPPPRPAANAGSEPEPSISRLAGQLPVRRPVWAGRAGAFSVGQLAYDHFPFAAWSELVSRHARRVCANSMNYSGPGGRKEFRETIAAYLRTSRGVRCEASQILVVNGSQQALDLSARVLLDPGSPVWVEDPGYEWLRHNLQLAGAKLIPVPVDEAGLQVAAGIRLCLKARAAYVTPSHQYPLGATMSAARRLQLLAWAHRSGGWIVEDDYDSEYRYQSLPVASLQGLDGGARVIYIGTFSKTLFPGLRLGYLIVPEALIERFAAVRVAADLCPPYLHQAALRDFLEEGHFARHVRKTRLLYGERRDALVRAIRREFGDDLKILGAEAGMHLVVTLPPGLSDRRIASRAADDGLWLQPLSEAYLGAGARQGFILGFGGIAAAQMEAQVRRLRKAIDR